MKKAIIYARFSDRPDAKLSESCEYQREYCETWCRANGYEIEAYFADKGVSGKTPVEKREGLGEAITTLRQGNALVVYNWDRLARDRMVHVVIESFVIGSGAHMVSVMNQATTDGESPEQEMMRGIIHSLSGYERKRNALRTSEAMLSHQSRGRRMSRMCPYGYMDDPLDPKLMVEHPEEQQAILRMIELREEGLGWRKVADALTAEHYRPRGEKWHHASLKKIVERTVFYV